MIPATPTTRVSLLESIASLLPGAQGDDCTFVALDGKDASGKTRLADDLAAYLRSSQSRPIRSISMDDFHNPRVVRYQISRSSSEGYYLHAFNYAQFRDYVLNPLSKGGTRRYRPKGHDLSTDVTIRDDESQIFEASPAAILIVDGVFLHRKELRDMWDISVYLDVAEETVKARMAGRGDVIGVEDPILQRYLGAHHIYIDECKPQDRATMVVDNSDFSRPVLIRDTR